MRICLLSIYSGLTDGSFQKFAFHLDRELSRQHKVLHLNLQGIYSLNFWKEIRRFRPDIIHYIPGPTLKSFIIVKMLASWCNGARTVMTALQPGYSPISRKFIPLFRPTLVLVQSDQSERVLSDLGCNTQFLPGGVDITKFAPLPQEAKALLRQKYQLAKEKFTVLTVAPIVRERGLELLGKIAGAGDYQVIIVGSTATNVDRHLLQNLQEGGCIIWPTYFTNIEEVYMLSDCYIFPSPVWCRHRMELPLSVLEAMSCNLAVISTKFGGLSQLFTEDDGLYFADGEEEFLSRLGSIRDGVEVRTRDKTLPYSWQKVTEGLEEIYKGVLSKG